MSSRYQTFPSCRASVVYRRTREDRVAGSECNEYHRRLIHLAQARRICLVSPSAPPSYPLSPRESRRRRRTRSTKTSRVSGAGSTDSRTVLQSAGELACRAFARPLMFLPLSLSSSVSLFLVVRPSVHPARTRDIPARTERFRTFRPDPSSCRLTSPSFNVHEPASPSRNEKAEWSVLRWIVDR